MVGEFQNKLKRLKKGVVEWYIRYIQRPTLAVFRMPGSGGFGVLLIIFTLTIVLGVID